MANWRESADAMTADLFQGVRDAHQAQIDNKRCIPLQQRIPDEPPNEWEGWTDPDLWDYDFTPEELHEDDHGAS